MNKPEQTINTLADVLIVVEGISGPLTRQRDMLSAVRRVCKMARVEPARVATDPASLRQMLRKIQPALHGISDKTWANLRSLFVAAIELAGVIDDMGRGRAVAHASWGPLMKAVASNKRMSCGLAAFANWCVLRDIAPDAVDDATVRGFLTWLESRTLSPRPRDVVRQVPNIWNEASAKFPFWPKVTLQSVSFRAPAKRVLWKDLPEAFRNDAEVYLAMRANPDVFDEQPNAPRRPLAPATIRLQREHFHSAASVLIEKGIAVSSLADLVRVDHFKTILRHFHDRAGQKANAFVQSLVRTLSPVARFHIGMPADDIDRLKRVAGKLPVVPFDLTGKNKSLLSQLESKRLRATLLFLPEQLIEEVAGDLDRDRVRAVWAQVAIAADILLVVPLRAQNLSALHWQQHFSEPDGPNGRLILHIPASETKTKKKDYVAEIPEDVARRLRWYRSRILPRLGSDTNGHLFVTKGGGPKSQETLSQQIVETLADRVGIHMTPHQFRHFAATLYLEERPEDFETARSLLGHSWGKTTLIYAGSSSRRASRAYGEFLVAEREKLTFAGKGRLRRRPKSQNEG